jgi:hypothetical protein
MKAAYATVGYTSGLDPLPNSRKKHLTFYRVTDVVTQLRQVLKECGLSVVVSNSTTLIVNSRLVLLVRTFLHNNSLKGYQLHFSDRAHWTLALLPSDRMTESDMEFYLLPRDIVQGRSLYIHKRRSIDWLQQFSVYWETLPDMVISTLATASLDVASIGAEYRPSEKGSENIPM